MRIYTASALALVATAAYAQHAPINKSQYGAAPLALTMLDSIIEREQGLTVNSSVKTSVIEGGLLLLGISEVLEYIEISPEQKTKYEGYLEQVTSGLASALENVTADTASPLDEFSVGTQLIKQFFKSGNQTLLTTIHNLHEADLQRKRQEDGSYWYYVYPNATTQDGLFSIPSFHALYACEFDPINALAAYQTAALQFSNIVSRCSSHSTDGLLYHGYDPTRSFPIWGNLTSRGHSQSIWGRAVGWTCTGLLLTLDVIPEEPATAALRQELIEILVHFINAVVKVQDPSGGWWQVLNFPDRDGNYLESSSTGLFTYAILRGLRLGFLGTGRYGDGVSVPEYRQSAEKGYKWLLNNAVLKLDDGTLGYNLTVDVCSINSTTSFDFYVSQPLKPQSLLGEVGFILTDVEIQIANKIDP